MARFAFFLLWAAYFAFGLWLRGRIPFSAENPASLHGLDYDGYGILMSNLRYITFTRARHPLFGLMTSPLTLFGSQFAKVSFTAYWAWTVAVFSALATGSVWLVYRISAALDGVGRVRAAACAAAFACFGYMRYLAACPESFPLSMLLALAAVRLAQRPQPQDADRRIFDNAVWAALFAASGGITVTQGVKTALAYAVSRKPGRRERKFICAAAVSAVAMSAAVCAVWLRGRFAGGIASAIAGHLVEIRSGMPLAERLRMLEMFFCEPIVPHGVPYDTCNITCGYGSWWQYAVCAAVYALAAAGAWRARRSVVVRVFAATFAVDALLHLVLFWGMAEAQIYCGHWFYMLPVLAAAALAGKKAEEKT